MTGRRTWLEPVAFRRRPPRPARAHDTAPQTADAGRGRGGRGSGVGLLGALTTTPRGDLALDVHADVSGARQALVLAGQLIGSPVVVVDADDAVRGVGVLRSADHAPSVSAAYAVRPLAALPVHMRKGRVLHMHDPKVSGIASCRHRDYAMTCEQFTALLERAGHRCEICRRAGVDTSHRQLYIDHDARRGMWAVRGLLCGRCNSMLQHAEIFTPAARTYLDASWFKTMLANAGVDDTPPEPPVGVTVGAGQACNWTRRKGGWSCSCGRHKSTRYLPRTWNEIVRRFGPHRLRIPAGCKPP